MMTEDGYNLWLRYQEVNDPDRMAQYREMIRNVAVLGESQTVEIIRNEAGRALSGLLGRTVSVGTQKTGDTSVVIGTLKRVGELGNIISQVEYEKVGSEGFIIQSQSTTGSPGILITGNTETALLTGTFHFLRLIQTQQDIHDLNIVSRPRVRHRILAHWDNLDGSIERGYAGKSLWNWDELPDHIDSRYHDYARACASIGINGVCLNNVNAQAKSLTTEYLVKTATLADVFRPYGIRVYLSPLFSGPMQLGGLSAADPRDPFVVAWWKNKADEIYSLIPDFGGFQVKANSEGQPGPQDYGANHDDGANMLASCLGPCGGIVLWRTFVYDTSVDADRAKCGYLEFKPLDGKFNSNVIVQVKNGPIDFQPREPFHPLLGAMEKTPLALELQITQEYLGQSKHLVYLADMWKEVLDSDTQAKGPGTTVAHIIDGSTYGGYAASTILGVSNTGTDRNWCGHHFSQANWYAFGRLAWDHTVSAESIAEEWIRSTWSNDSEIVDTIKKLMMDSWPACVNYMTPLGLHHIMQEGHHYGPDPGFDSAPREDWNCTYYHRADSKGAGFDRSSTGSHAVSQYHSPLRETVDNLNTCPEKFLLWFHHVPWEHRLRSGRTLWDELGYRYQDGVNFVEEMYNMWQSLQTRIDPQRYEHVLKRLKQQLDNARTWRDVCIEYFGKFVNSISD